MRVPVIMPALHTIPALLVMVYLIHFCRVILLTVAGGKYDYTTKWWDARRYQEVVDGLRGRVLFVQVGEKHHWHPRLRGVLDLVGETDLRQLVRLTHHADGVLTPVSLMMHLAAAVSVRPGSALNRACVVIAGGREPAQWEAYPHHQFLHTNGALRCCDNGGCWKARTIPLGDGDSKDLPASLCVDVVGALPRCMDLITTDDVRRGIEVYLRGGAARELSADEWRRVEPLLTTRACIPSAPSTPYARDQACATGG